MLFHYYCTWLITHAHTPGCGKLAALRRRKHLRQYFPNPGAQAVLGEGSEKPYLPRRVNTAGTTGSPQLESGSPQTWPDLSCLSLLPRQGRQPGLGSTDPRNCCFLWQGVNGWGQCRVASVLSCCCGPPHRVLACHRCEPSLWLPPMHMFL